MTPPKGISPNEVWEMMESPSAVLVTVNQRLTRYLKACYNDRQAQAGKTVWETPKILPYKTWVQQLYDQSLCAGPPESTDNFKMLLSTAQERYVWEQVIRASKTGERLLQVPQTADAVKRAWELRIGWRLPAHELSRLPTDETRAFLGWSEHFERKCRKKKWLDNAGLVDIVADKIRSGCIKVPGLIILAGFDEWSPQQMDLLLAVERSGGSVVEMAEPADVSFVRRTGLADRETEMAAAANWARGCLEQNPDCRIGIVVPDLEAKRAALIRHLDDALHPSRVLSPDDSGPRLFNISKGRPLSDYPVVRAAILMLNFSYRPLQVAETTELLMSPFVGGAKGEIPARALLDAHIRESGEISMPLSGLIRFSGSPENSAPDAKPICPDLYKQLQSFQETARQSGTFWPSEWAKIFHSLFLAIGWPGDRTLTSEEYQTVEDFKKALLQFAAMDLVASRMDIRTAVAEFTQLVRGTEFQPETGEVPIQVLGLLESAGERFDHLWVMGLDAETWPQTASPNPFLPVRVQREYKVPHADADREFQFAGQLTARLLGAADHVIVSYPLKDGDTELGPSPLIAGLECISCNAAKSDWWMRIHEARAYIETLIDQRGPSADAHSRLSGGTGLIKAQAACPFSAFATYRLHARPIEIPEPGLNARERGSLVHSALEFFWEKMKTQAALISQTIESLREAVGLAVEYAVAEVAKNHPRTFTRQFTLIEIQRLTALVLEWLEMDRRRSAFTVVGREEKLVCTIADIELRTYADRIDRLPDGRLVIVDYKTGEPSVKDWFSDRIAEPQLPLYSFAVNEPVAGVVFGQIKKGRAKYLGVAEDTAIAPDMLLPGMTGKDTEAFGSMRDVIAFWRQKIEILAEEVRQGVAMVSPVSLQKNCQYCDLGPMCRIGEIDFLEQQPFLPET